MSDETSATNLPTIGVCFDRAFPAAMLPDYARAVESNGLDNLWLIEDCFFTAGVSLAATALAITERIDVGIGIMPAVARNPAITAMEIATLANLAPGRFIGGIGHGVQEWMAQMGVRPASPLTALGETFTVVRRLLAGEEVTFEGETVRFDRVQLDAPPTVRPRLMAGVQQQRSMQLAGHVADGVILVEGAGPTYIDWVLGQTGRSADEFAITTFSLLVVDDDPRRAYADIAPFVAGLISERRTALTVLPYFDELSDRVQRGGAEALVDMPADYWREIGAIGTPDDALAHVISLAEAGVESINFFPGPDPEQGWKTIDAAAQLRRRLRSMD